jgi:hypothetical protein
LIERIVGLHASLGRASTAFTVRADDDTLTIVPTRMRDVAGEWTTVRPVLDTLVALPAGTLTLTEFMDVFCQHLTAASGSRVTPGNLGSRRQVDIGTLS